MKVIVSMVALAGLVSACQSGESGETPDMSSEIVVNGAQKKTSGTLQYLQQGDVACYAGFTDGADQEFSEMADFAVCDEAGLIGEKVFLQYQMGNVLAASCQGDYDCGRSDWVPLVVAMSLEPLAPLLDSEAQVSPFLYLADFDFYGYFTVQDAVQVGGLTLTGIALPANGADMFDTGEGLVPAFIIDFEANGGYDKVFPDSFRITSETVEFVGTHPQAGTVTLVGEFDATAMRNGLESGLYTAHETLLTGTLTVGDDSVSDVHFAWSGDR